jgi:hypothetical protein
MGAKRQAQAVARLLPGAAPQAFSLLTAAGAVPGGKGSRDRTCGPQWNAPLGQSHWLSKYLCSGDTTQKRSQIRSVNPSLAQQGEGANFRL